MYAEEQVKVKIVQEAMTKKGGNHQYAGRWCSYLVKRQLTLNCSQNNDSQLSLKIK